VLEEPLRFPSRKWPAVQGFGHLTVAKALGLEPEGAEDAEPAAGEEGGKKGKKGSPKGKGKGEAAAEGEGGEAGGGDTTTADCAVVSLVSTAHRAFIVARDSAHETLSTAFAQQVRDVVRDYDAMQGDEEAWGQNWLRMVESLRSDDTML